MLSIMVSCIEGAEQRLEALEHQFIDLGCLPYNSVYSKLKDLQLANGVNSPIQSHLPLSLNLVSWGREQE